MNSRSLSLRTDFIINRLSLICLLCTFLPESALQAQGTAPSDAFLSHLVGKSGLNGGLLLLPRFSGPSEVLALAENTPFTVVACAPEEPRVRQLRDAAAAQGLLAKKLYVEQASASSSPLAEKSVSLLLVDDLRASDLTPDNRDAWIGTLSPRRGVAILGNRVAGELDGAKLLDWATGKGVEVEALSVPGSTFVKIRKLAEENADVWTHRFHDPSNQRTSGDTSLQAPLGPAWYSLPTNLGYRGDIIVSHGGRAYYIWANRLPYHSVSLICFDIHNGTKLWEQPFTWDQPRDNNEAGYYAGRSCMVALPDGLLLLDEDRLVILDGETGAERKAIEGPKPGGQIKWLGVEGDLVAVLAGEPDHYKTGTLQQYATNPHGTELAVYRLSDGALVWTRSEAGLVDERETAILEGKLYTHTRGERMACSDLATGEILWENRDPELLKLLAEEQTGRFITPSYRILVATPEVLYFAASIRANRVVMDRTDGKLLWAEKVGKTRLSLNDTLVGNKLIKHGWANETVDLKSNRKLETLRVPHQGCGPSLCTTVFFITQFGQVTSKGGDVLRRGDLKSPCDLGVIVADGVGFSPPSACKCNVEIHGYRAFTSRPAEPAEDPRPQLVTGPALDTPLLPSGPRAEWRSWRGDNRNSGSLDVGISSPAPSLQWRWKPVQPNPVPKLPEKYGAPHVEEPSHLPTQAVSEEGVAYFGDSQGVLRAVSMREGRELWNYPAGFRLIAPPTLARGRVVAGALDGEVVCLDAQSGELAWRYRVPQRRRRIFWYGHLTDTHPLVGGVLVHGDMVYTAAGFSTVNSIRVAALNLADGEPKWTRTIAYDDPNAGFLGSMGAMTVADGQLFIRSGGQVPASFDLETGARTALPDVQFAALPRYGKDIAAVDENWILHGGRRVYSDYNRWKQPANNTGYTLCRVDRELEGKPAKPVLGVELSMISALMPVFDGELFIIFNEYQDRRTKQEIGIQAWKRQVFLEAASGIESKDAKGQTWLEKKLEGMPFVFGELDPKAGEVADKALWTEKGRMVYTAALGSDALIVLHPEGAGNRDRLSEKWRITALERGDGSVRWTVDLPERPVWDGLSLSSDGSILIALYDGSMVCLR